jgi:hypothetical protein
MHEIQPPAPACSVHAGGWKAELLRRLRTNTLRTTCGICGFVWVFFLAYFHILRHPAGPMTIMPLTPVDRWIPFQPLALAPYLSLWFYLGFAPGLMACLRGLLSYAAWITGLCVTGLACFYFFPTAVPALEFDVSGHPGFALLQGVDATGNACPSLHVATAVFTGIWVDVILRTLLAPRWPRAVNLIWLGLIVYSTLATKQHVLLDAVAGGFLGTVFALASLHWRPGRPNRDVSGPDSLR